MAKRVWPEIKIGDFRVDNGIKQYTVYGYIGEVDEYIEGKAYINKDTEIACVCVKTGRVPNNIPIVKINDMDEIEYIRESPYEGTSNNPFHLKNIKKLDLKTISKNTPENGNLYDEQALADMNSATSMYIPSLNDKDDSLKKCVKHSIIGKKVNVNKYKHSMGTKYGFTNLKAILDKDTKMSIPNFEKFMELEECYYMIIVYDKGTDTKTPLLVPLVYSSERGRVEELTKEDIKRMMAMLQLKLSDLND